MTQLLNSELVTYKDLAVSIKFTPYISRRGKSTIALFLDMNPASEKLPSNSMLLERPALSTMNLLKTKPS
jgi:hypothetical protein